MLDGAPCHKGGPQANSAVFFAFVVTVEAGDTGFQPLLRSLF